MQNKDKKKMKSPRNVVSKKYKSLEESVKLLPIKKEFTELQTLVCRVCLKSGIMPIYGGENSDDLSELLIIISGLNIRFDDVYPKYLCNSCYSFLKTAILFRQTAQKSDEVLKNGGNITVPVKVHNETEDIADNHNDDIGNTDDLTSDFKNSNQIPNNRHHHLNFENIESYKSENDADNNDTDKSDHNAISCNKSNKSKGKKIFICRRCDLKFETPESYQNHTESVEHTEKREMCQICNKSYKSSYFKQHMAIHLKLSTHICDICGKVFQTRRHFLKHRVTHFYDLPFKCSLCPYRGRFPECLKMHMRSHTGEKPYSCDMCPGRTFTHKSNLNKHISRIHKGSPFKCEPCGRGFYNKASLELHFKVDHTGIKEHICTECGKAFGYRKQMTKHQLKVHKREKRRNGKPLHLQPEAKKALEGDKLIDKEIKP